MDRAPRLDARANPSPFGFPITVREGVDRRAVVNHLEAAKIETRLVFGGNILRQPGFTNIEHRVSGTLEQSDVIMRDTFFVGVYPGLTDEMIDYMIETMSGFCPHGERRAEGSRICLRIRLAADLDHILGHTAELWDEFRGNRIFITGGTGFFGCWLLESFAWANDQLGSGRRGGSAHRDAEAFREKAPHLARIRRSAATQAISALSISRRAVSRT